MQRREFLRAGALLTLAGATGTCIAGETNTAEEVRIEKSRFEPAERVIPPGTTVRWSSHEKRGYHTVLWLDGTLPSPAESPPLFPGDSYERRFDAPGEYNYRCGPHPEMRGRIIVR